MTNPNNAVGTNGAFGGRTSVNAFNDALATYNDRGVLSGWACLANSGMTVELGGVSGIRDVAVAMDANGNFTTINNISGSPIDVTLPAAPGTNKRIDVVVAYVDNPPQGNATDTDNPGACGIIPVSGTVAANPSMPNETTIRSAITADGASGSSAYYVVLAKVTVASGTTDIDNTMIEAGQHAQIQGATVGTGALADGAVTADKIDWTTIKKITAYTDTRSDLAAQSLIRMTDTRINNGFTLGADGGVVIPEDGYYMLSAEVSGLVHSGQGWIGIVKNSYSTTIANSLNRNTSSADAYTSCTIPNVILSLSAGDKIYVALRDAMYVNSGIATDIMGTYLTIVKIS